jgi:hypothetical protein
MRPPPPPQALSPEHSTSTKPSSAAKRAFTSRTALSTKGHEAPPERKKRKTPPPDSTPAKTSDATEPSSKKMLVLFGRACCPDDEARVPETLAAPCCAGGGEQSSKGAAQVKNAGHQSINDALGHKAKTLDEMRKLYPHLVDESMALLDPAVLERVLPRIDDNEAQALDKKIKRARRQLTKAIRESVSKPFLSLIKLTWEYDFPLITLNSSFRPSVSLFNFLVIVVVLLMNKLLD